MGILEGLAAKVAGDRAFNQNAEKYVPGVVTPDAYNRGISQEDAYKLKLAEDAAFKNMIRNNYSNSKQYVADSRSAETIPHLESYVPFNDGMTDDSRRREEALEAAYDARSRRNAYNNNIDQGLAAKWMQSYKGR